jgi:hypothetical protein
MLRIATSLSRRQSNRHLPKKAAAPYLQSSKSCALKMRRPTFLTARRGSDAPPKRVPVLALTSMHVYGTERSLARLTGPVDLRTTNSVSKMYSEPPWRFSCSIFSKA